MPLKELERLAAVNRFLKLEISKEKEIQEIVELAAKICGTPTALVTLVADTLLDNRFVDNPLVTGGPGIRFYAGAPLTTQDEFNLGSLCVIYYEILP